MQSTPNTEPSLVSLTAQGSLPTFPGFALRKWTTTSGVICFTSAPAFLKSSKSLLEFQEYNNLKPIWSSILQHFWSVLFNTTIVLKNPSDGASQKHRVTSFPSSTPDISLAAWCSAKTLDGVFFTMGNNFSSWLQILWNTDSARVFHLESTASRWGKSWWYHSIASCAMYSLENQPPLSPFTPGRKSRAPNISET